MEKSWIPVQSSLNPLNRFQQDLVVVKGKVLCCQKSLTIPKALCLKVHIKESDFLGIIASLDLVDSDCRQIDQMGNGDDPTARIASWSRDRHQLLHLFQRYLEVYFFLDLPNTGLIGILIFVHKASNQGIFILIRMGLALNNQEFYLAFYEAVGHHIRCYAGRLILRQILCLVPCQKGGLIRHCFVILFFRHSRWDILFGHEFFFLS